MSVDVTAVVRGMALVVNIIQITTTLDLISGRMHQYIQTVCVIKNVTGSVLSLQLR